MPHRRLLLPAVLLLAALPGLAPRASAEDEAEPTGAAYAETELRLKTAGVDATMRARIHAAIRDGVAALREVQQRDGSILGSPGQTVLGGLALAHAGIPDGAEGAAAARAWLRRRGRKEVAKRTYEAGIANMLLVTAERSRGAQKLLLDIHARLARGPLLDRGYWGYDSAGGGNTPNLSTAQFACLGLWAAERGGAEPAARAWRTHLHALLAAQRDNGSWGYYPHGDPNFPRTAPTGYPTGTFMGAADLALAQAALAEELAEDPEADARVRIALAKAKGALRRHGAWVLTAQAMVGHLGHFPYYRLYALEKACIFLELEDLGGIPWYREGAQWLLDRRIPGSGWSGSTAVALDDVPPLQRHLKVLSSAQHTAFALLFLLRASASYHPITPRPMPSARPRVVTPGGGPAPEAASEAPQAPARRAPPLVLAAGIADRLEKALKGTHLRSLRPVLDGIRLASRTYRQSRGPEGFASAGHETWARRIDDLMLRLATRFRRARVHDRVLWQAVSLAALEALPDLHPRVGPRLMEAVLAVEPDGSFRRAFRHGWYATAIEALRRLDPPGLAAWLRTRALHDDPEAWPLASAALTALGGMAPALTGRQRHRVARGVWDRLDDLRSRAAGRPEALDLMRDVLVLLHRVAAPAGRAADLPPLGSVNPQGDIEALRRWWRAHRAPDDPLWR